jgi:hypothetical protein
MDLDTTGGPIIAVVRFAVPTAPNVSIREVGQRNSCFSRPNLGAPKPEEKSVYLPDRRCVP